MKFCRSIVAASAVLCQGCFTADAFTNILRLTPYLSQVQTQHLPIQKEEYPVFASRTQWTYSPLTRLSSQNDSNADKADNDEKRRETTALGEPNREKRYYTYEELQSNNELREIEEQQTRDRTNLWSLPSRISGAITATAWIFLAASLFLNSQGYAFIVDRSTNRIYVDTLEQREFINTLYKKDRSATTRPPTRVNMIEGFINHNNNNQNFID